MAVIPNADDFARRVPRSGRRLAAIPNVGRVDVTTGIGESLLQAGIDLARIEQNRLQREERVASAKAKSYFLQEAVAADVEDEVSGPTDNAKRLQVYQDRMSKARAAALAMVPGDEAKQLLDADFTLDITQGHRGIYKRYIAEERRGYRAGFNERVAGYLEGALNAKDPALASRFLEAFRADRDEMVSLQALDAEESRVATIEWQEKYAETLLMRLPTAAAKLEALAAGRGIVTVGKPAGLIEEGTIDLGARRFVQNADGSRSTIKAMTIEVEGETILLPTIGPDRQQWSDDEAVEHYLSTGDHLGKFKTEKQASEYATALSGKMSEIAEGGSRHWASFISAPNREVLKQRFLRENEEETTRVDSQVAADRILSQHPGNYEAQVRAAKASGEGKIRDATLARIDAQKSRDDRALADRIDRTLESITGAVYGSADGSLDNVKDSTLAWLRTHAQGRVEALESYIKKRNLGPEPTRADVDRAMVWFDSYRTQVAATNGKHALEVPLEKVLNETWFHPQRQSVVAWVTETRAKLAEPDKPVDLNPTVGRVSSMIENLGQGLNLKPGSVDRAQFEMRAWALVEEYRKGNGGNYPPQKELERIAAELAREQVKSRWTVGGIRIWDTVEKTYKMLTKPEDVVVPPVVDRYVRALLAERGIKADAIKPEDVARVAVESQLLLKEAIEYLEGEERKGPEENR